MGALATAWQARLSLQQQYNLTNPDVEGANTVNAALLANAETDTINWFFNRTGVTFDPTQSSHVTVGISGVTYALYTYRGLPKAAATEAARDEWFRQTDAFARTQGALVWNSPLTDSLITPTRDDPNSLPYMDREIIGDLRPNQFGNTWSDNVEPTDLDR